MVHSMIRLLHFGVRRSRRAPVEDLRAGGANPVHGPDTRLAHARGIGRETGHAPARVAAPCLLCQYGSKPGYRNCPFPSATYVRVPEGQPDPRLFTNGMESTWRRKSSASTWEPPTRSSRSW